MTIKSLQIIYPTPVFSGCFEDLGCVPRSAVMRGVGKKESKFGSSFLWLRNDGGKTQ
jgi:hypothetical protein